MTPYQEALALTLGAEDGYYDGSEARDPNPTNFGVTQATYDLYRRGKQLELRPVKQIEQAEVEAIYRSYWVAAGCEMLPRLTAIATFDMSINGGAVTAVKVLQRALGVVDDGVFGPKTDGAMRAYRDTYGDKQLALKVSLARLTYYYSLAVKNPKMLPNLPSWVQRVVHFGKQFLV
jgi:lysozyme family protein